VHVTAEKIALLCTKSVGTYLRSMPNVLSVATLRLLRQDAQLLSRRRKLAAHDVVRHLLGVQAQIYGASHLAIRARSPLPTSADVETAVTQDRSLVWTWAMRGTLHLISAEDYGWLVPLLVRRAIPNALRRLAQEGVPDDHAEQAIRLTESLVANHGHLSRAEIAEGVSKKGIRIEGQAAAHLVWLASARGLICHGPVQNGERHFVLVSDWLGGRRSRLPDDGLKELALRYLKSHAPATPEDLARWAGITLSEARTGWAQIASRVRAVSTRQSEMSILRSQKNEVQEAVTRLVPSFEEFLLGWESRAFCVSKAVEREIIPGGGILRPAVIRGGRVVGTWSLKRGSRRGQIRVRPLARVSTTEREAVNTEVKDVGRFLGIEIALANRL
jgi:hypothetical protein